MSRAKELQNRIDQLRKELAELAGRSSISSTASIVHRHTEIIVLGSQLAEISTRRLVRLTWGLIFLTAGLLAYTVFIYQDAHKEAQRDTPKQDSGTQKP